MNQFKNLKVWQASVDLAVEVYSITSKFPDKERFGLVSQINRSVVSIPSNIAEGAGRNSKKEFNNFLGIASGSLSELETQLIISNKLNYLSDETLSVVIEKIHPIHKMIYSLQKKLQS